LLTGPFTGKKVVWDADTLRHANSTEIGLNIGCVSYVLGAKDTLGLHSSYTCTAHGWVFDSVNVITDPRDKTQYKTIKIGDRIVMAENLNYEVGGQSYCYNNSADSCAKYGRLYTWAAAVGKSEEECGPGKSCKLTGVVRGVCPEGWHLPDTTEWNTLYKAMGSSLYAMQAKGYENWPNATDAYGFSALPAGYRDGDGNINGVGSYAFFWSATEFNKNNAYYWSLNANHASRMYSGKWGHSVRCVKD